MINLGIAPNRLYIGIINDESGDLEFWITDEEGNKVSNRYIVNINKNISIRKMFDGWKARERSIIINMEGEELLAWLNYWNKEFGVPFKKGPEQKRRVQNISYFSKGFIAIASPDDQPEETNQLLDRFAAVFNLTYTRFNDLQIAEAHAVQAEEDLQKLHAEKKRTEEALVELQATQKQLIQSEKMASLGELTAGIAHEIQNPLNFVNNFSEVSNELLDEMLEEVAKGNYDEVKAIVDDVKQNLEKINHHGKRADGIVKGMLQHSRSSTATKEPTDINKLTDEYLRLAYHGLRAKDKSFNAAMKTEYDETTGHVNVIPQDIGRVVLNLITNAFYVVTEKKKQEVAGFEPTVTVSTKRNADKMEIIVKDNGNGIPQKIFDKIFQPFFTTKPTGQGTGLGLSLSYDIVKAHGGELKAETKEGEGSTFIIQIPIN
jgi:signal transduction histidine kinase